MKAAITLAFVSITIAEMVSDDSSIGRLMQAASSEQCDVVLVDRPSRSLVGVS